MESLQLPIEARMCGGGQREKCSWSLVRFLVPRPPKSGAETGHFSAGVITSLLAEDCSPQLAPRPHGSRLGCNARWTAVRNDWPEDRECVAPGSHVDARDWHVRCIVEGGQRFIS